MKTPHRIFDVLAFVLLACALAAPAQAGELGTPIDTERLDSMRGGFAMPTGFVVSFGIDRVVSVNGDIVAATSLRIPDIARLTAEQATQLAALRDSQVVQVGAGTVVAGGTGGLVIQNAVDGQAISARTSLDVSLNTLQLHRDGLLGTAITNAIVGARAP